jgi:hypothetical protein
MWARSERGASSTQSSRIGASWTSPRREAGPARTRAQSGVGKISPGAFPFLAPVRVFMRGIATGGEESLFVARDYDRTRVHAGRSCQHLLAPRVGYLAARAKAAIYPDATSRRCRCAALCCAGRDEWQEGAERAVFPSVLLVDGSEDVHMNWGAAARLGTFARDTYSVLRPPSAPTAGKSER